MSTTKFQRYPMFTTSTISTFGASATAMSRYRCTARLPRNTRSVPSTRCATNSASNTRRFRSTGEAAEPARPITDRRRASPSAISSSSKINKGKNYNKVCSAIDPFFWWCHEFGKYPQAEDFGCHSAIVHMVLELWFLWERRNVERNSDVRRCVSSRP